MSVCQIEDGISIIPSRTNLDAPVVQLVRTHVWYTCNLGSFPSGRTIIPYEEAGSSFSLSMRREGFDSPMRCHFKQTKNLLGEKLIRESTWLAIRSLAGSNPVSSTNLRNNYDNIRIMFLVCVCNCNGLPHSIIFSTWHSSVNWLFIEVRCHVFLFTPLKHLWMMPGFVLQRIRLDSGLRLHF